MKLSPCGTSSNVNHDFGELGEVAIICPVYGTNIKVRSADVLRFEDFGKEA